MADAGAAEDYEDDFEEYDEEADAKWVPSPACADLRLSRVQVALGGLHCHRAHSSPTPALAVAGRLRCRPRAPGHRGPISSTRTSPWATSSAGVVRATASRPPAARASGRLDVRTPDAGPGRASLCRRLRGVPRRMGWA